MSTNNKGVKCITSNFNKVKYRCHIMANSGLKGDFVHHEKDLKDVSGNVI